MDSQISQVSKVLATPESPPNSVPLNPLSQFPGNPSHKPECQCLLCTRIRKARAEGKPSKKEKKALAAKRREERGEVKVAIKASLKTQIALGRTPDVTLAARVAKNGNGRVETVERNTFVQTALAAAGITDESLATLAKEGMEAFNQKIITDQDGAIVDVVNMPDWRNRHAFWRDILMVKKLLGNDAESSAIGSGGLVIITPDAAKVSTGHPSACVCEDCRVAWQEKARHLRASTVRENAIIVESRSPEPQHIVESKDSDDFD